MSNLIDITKSIVDRIDRDMKVLNIQGSRVYVCSTKYATICKTVYDKNTGDEYEVTAFSEEDGWLELTPKGNAPAFAGTVVLAPKITFLHGTPASVNNEYLAIESRQSKKTPFIWLLENYTEESQEADSSIDAAYAARVFFMEGAVDDDNPNAKINENAIKPMKALTELFLDVIKQDYNFKTLTDISRTVRPRFGVEVLNRGSDRRIIDDALSGYEMRLTLEVYDTTLCKTNC